MAATAVYASVRHISSQFRAALDSPVVFSNIAATTSAFALTGGVYGVKVKASTYGTVTLQVLLDDGVTYVTALTAFSADGFNGNVSLPPGSYRFAVA